MEVQNEAGESGIFASGWICEITQYLLFNNRVDQYQ